MSSVTGKRLLVAGLSSGSGKTSVCVGLAGALRSRGQKVAVFKVGPDYLDPTYLSLAAGVPCVNLDLWLMGEQACLAEVREAERWADLVLIEGVMGLFDGLGPESDEGSSAHLARLLGAAVVLCVDVQGMARTLAAVVQGVQTHAPDMHLLGVIGNQVGSPRHLELLRQALHTLPRPVPLLGGLAKKAAPAFPSRHLGLETARAGAESRLRFAAWEAAVAGAMDLEALLQAVAQSSAGAGRAGVTPSGAEPLASLSPAVADGPASGVEQTACRIAVAQDEAFHFYYPHNLRALRAAGAELIPFSPLRDQGLPERVDGVWVGGGFPELYAEQLAGQRALAKEICDRAACAMPLYAECGGLMWLADAIVDLDGNAYPQLGQVPGQAVMAERLQALGYVELRTRMDGMLGPAGTTLRGHQFRYSRLVGAGGPTRYDAVRRRDGYHFRCGYGSGQVWASYVHVHWARSPQVPRAFVAACVQGRRV